VSNYNKILEQANKIRYLIKRNQEKEIIPTLYESYQKLLEIINRNHQLKDNFTIQDIDDFFRFFPFYEGKSLYEISKKKFSKILREQLYQEPKENQKNRMNSE